MCAGERKNAGHRSKRDEEVDEEEKDPRVSMDYFFMSTQDEKEENNPLIVMVDESTGDKYVRSVGRKGTQYVEWLIKDMLDELKAWGHPGGGENQLILKSDGEPSIVALKESLARYMVDESHRNCLPKEKASQMELQKKRERQ